MKLNEQNRNQLLCEAIRKQNLVVYRGLTMNAIRQGEIGKQIPNTNPNPNPKPKPKRNVGLVESNKVDSLKATNTFENKTIDDDKFYISDVEEK